MEYKEGEILSLTTDDLVKSHGEEIFEYEFFCGGILGLIWQYDNENEQAKDGIYIIQVHVLYEGQQASIEPISRYSTLKQIVECGYSIADIEINDGAGLWMKTIEQPEHEIHVSET